MKESSPTNQIDLSYSDLDFQIRRLSI